MTLPGKRANPRRQAALRLEGKHLRGICDSIKTYDLCFAPE
ncbi:MAG TPA: hypothetical protein PKE45_05715 [Caldilineaceae bacterium]|nr:hypothetical protein [Caldilineaceae bacterium]